MNLFHQIASMAMGAVLLIGVWAAAVTLPKYRRVGPPLNTYHDMVEISKDETTPIDGSIGIPQLQRGDVIAYRTTPADDDNLAFAYVVALPGEVITVSQGSLSVDERPWEKTPVPHTLGEVPALVVPKGHVYVFSDRHEHDSVAYGPIPGTSILGRVKGL